MIIFLLILINIVLSASGQLLIKAGVNKITPIVAAPSFMFFLKCFISPLIISGLFLYFLAALIWFVVLSKTELSIAYPPTSLIFVLILFSGYFFLGESLSFSKCLGVAFICLGTIAIFR